MASAYSNPAPPSERPKARVPETPLRNSDFRALLDTPRAERLAEYTPKGGDGEQKEKKPKKPYRPKPEAPKEEVDEGPQYRSAFGHSMRKHPQGVRQPTKHIILSFHPNRSQDEK